MLSHKTELPALWRLTQEDYGFEVSVGCIGYTQKGGEIKGTESQAS